MLKEIEMANKKIKFVNKFCKEHNVTLDNYKEYIKFVEDSQWLLKNGYIEFKESRQDVTGDGWTVDVISHILSFIPEIKN